MFVNKSSSSALLFTVGGFANQIFQLAYLYYLKKSFNINPFVSNLLLSPFIASMLGVAKREPVPLFNSLFHHLSFAGLVYYLLKKLPRISRLSIITDSTVIDCYCNSSFYATYLLKGYFHNRYVFEDICTPFWVSVLKMLDQASLPSASFSPSNSLVVHLRLGDYLSPKNSSVYASITPEQIHSLIHNASNVSRYYFVSDSPTLASLFFSSPPLNSYRFKDLSSNSREQDLCTLSKFSYIIGSNSSYSIIASILSYVRSPLSSKSFYFPSKWFLDPEQNFNYHSTFLKFIPCSSFY
jgi:hypothetical protein